MKDLVAAMLKKDPEARLSFEVGPGPLPAPPTLHKHMSTILLCGMSITCDMPLMES
jgi:hypothetical protein